MQYKRDYYQAKKAFGATIFEMLVNKMDIECAVHNRAV